MIHRLAYLSKNQLLFRLTLFVYLQVFSQTLQDLLFCVLVDLLLIGSNKCFLRLNTNDSSDSSDMRTQYNCYILL